MACSFLHSGGFLGSFNARRSLLLLLCMCPLQVQAESFMGSRPPVVQAQVIEADLQKAIVEALGHGHGVEQERLLQIREIFLRMFKSLPKNAYDRVDRPMLRYALHRYFAQRYSINVKGLEPARNSSSSESVGAEILLDNVPAYVETMLEARFAHHGFGLEDVAAIAAALEELILGSSARTLEKAYAMEHLEVHSSLHREAVEDVLDAYVLHWLVGDGVEITTQLESERKQIEEALPKFNEVTDFARGEMDRSEYDRQVAGKSNPFSVSYGFADVQNIVRGITAGFGHWWEQECQDIKSNLMAEDSESSGRVRLSNFYRRNMEGEWRFGESESYLRELGALDDSSLWRGPQVLIPNYLLSANNCIVTSTYYLVCCVNECEGLLKRVEDAIQAPVASPEQILEVVQGMMSESELSRLHGGLDSQLRRIAESHRGNVPLHGRLFAQWMHFAFPQECQFPHLSGTVRARTPLEFGDSYIASDEEIKKHAGKGAKNKPVSLKARAAIDEQLEMSQWLHEEELLTDYAELKPFWASGPLRLMGAIAMALALYMLAQALPHGALQVLSDSRGKHDINLKQYAV